MITTKAVQAIVNGENLSNNGFYCVNNNVSVYVTDVASDGLYFATDSSYVRVFVPYDKKGTAKITPDPNPYRSPHYKPGPLETLLPRIKGGNAFSWCSGGGYDRTMCSANVDTKFSSTGRYFYAYRDCADDTPLHVGREAEVIWRDCGFFLSFHPPLLGELMFRKKYIRKDADKVDKLNKILHGRFVQKVVSERKVHSVGIGVIRAYNLALTHLVTSTFTHDTRKLGNTYYPSEVWSGSTLPHEISPCVTDSLMEFTLSFYDALEDYVREGAWFSISPQAVADPSKVCLLSCNRSLLAAGLGNSFRGELQQVAARTGMPAHPLLPFALMLGGRIELSLSEV